MALIDIFKVSRKTFFYPSAWLGTNTIKNVDTTIRDTVSSVFLAPEAPARKETFEEALVRLNVTEEQVQESAKNYFMYACVFAGFALIALLYSLYLLFAHKVLLGFLLGLAVVAMFSAQAFRFHFYFFQIKHRKLGCTFEEWWQGKTNPEQESKP